MLTVLTFRTAKEAIALANNTVFGLGASVWTENVSLGLEVAISIKAGACWINCHNQFDAAAGFGGFRESGYGRDGGKEVGGYIVLTCIQGVIDSTLLYIPYLCLVLYLRLAITNV